MFANFIFTLTHTTSGEKRVIQYEPKIPTLLCYYYTRIY
uniref:Uncharacterized protein n=1 Tax=Rhizophora mucronata TaxID=61149 RepID=A0A2P2QIS0_RHIMU